MTAPHDHIVKSFDEELKRLNQVVAQMGGLAETQLRMAVDALAKRDTNLASIAVEHDYKIDVLEREIDHDAVKILALRQPMALDLREVIAALKISADLERIGDYAANVAKRTLALAQMPVVEPSQVIPRLGKLVSELVKDVLDAYLERDAEKAVAAWRKDEEVDAMYTSLFRELLTYMMEDPRNIGPCTHLMFIAKNIERIGDHATNIAENVYFLVKGYNLSEPRPKGDRTINADFPYPPGGKA